MVSLKRLIFFVFCLFLSACSDGSTVDDLFGIGDDNEVIEVPVPVPVPVNLSMTIDSPAALTSTGFEKTLSGTCGTAGKIIEITGVITDFTVCGIGGVWSKTLSFVGAPTGNITLNMRMIDDSQDLKGDIVSLTLNRISNACDSEAARNDTFANVDSGPPWFICTARQLSNLRNNLNDDFEIHDDIDVGLFITIPGVFTGNMNGNDFTLSNILISNATGDNVALFEQAGNSAGQTIENFRIENADVLGQRQVAIFVAKAVDDLDFDDIHLDGFSIESTRTNNTQGIAGALVALVNNNGALDLTVTDISVSGDVSVKMASDFGGGLFGRIRDINTLNLSNININVNDSSLITGSDHLGGIAGEIEEVDTIASNLSSNLDIESSGGIAGGLIGDAHGSYTNVNSSANLTSTDVVNDLGGLFGHLAGATSQVISTTPAATRDGAIGLNSQPTSTPTSLCFSTGRINASSADNVGGLIGRSNAALVEACYASGNVSGANDVGGLIGESTGLVINDSFAESTVSASGIRTGGLIGYVTNAAEELNDSYATGPVINTSVAADQVGGLVGYWRGTVKAENLSFYGDVTVISGDDSGAVTNIGGLMGQAQTSTCDNCTSSGTLTVTVAGTANIHENVGGLIGNNSMDISNSSSTMTVIALQSQDVGGLIGQNSGNTSNLAATGNVQGLLNVGGLIGQSTAATNDSWASGNVYAVNGTVGGVIGFSDANVYRCFSTGDVTSDGDYVGGITGNSGDQNNRELQFSFSTGDIDGGANSFVGGITGRISTRANRFLNNFATGRVRGGQFTGGIAGEVSQRSQSDAARRNYFVGSVVRALGAGGAQTDVGPLWGSVDGNAVEGASSFFLEDNPMFDENTGSSFTGNTDDQTVAVNGLTAAEMLIQANFVNFDFGVPEWEYRAGYILPGESAAYPYPVLSWVPLITPSP